MDKYIISVDHAYFIAETSEDAIFLMDHFIPCVPRYITSEQRMVYEQKENYEVKITRVNIKDIFKNVKDIK